VNSQEFPVNGAKALCRAETISNETCLRTGHSKGLRSHSHS
jgi:hypothetical protein